ncbi:hypothetical protein SAMN05216469_102204 [Ruminococcus albus]|uniref:Uncharacterized protein n=1 Tax=Ruminococcus albus TaxID=1264 RepID=A0A1H7GP48_RUMAL|nr:hypothetical protein SAMN05216469_102204 [Ruminococcus albus]
MLLYCDYDSEFAVGVDTFHRVESAVFQHSCLFINGTFLIQPAALLPEFDISVGETAVVELTFPEAVIPFVELGIPCAELVVVDEYSASGESLIYFCKERLLLRLFEMMYRKGGDNGIKGNCGKLFYIVGSLVRHIIKPLKPAFCHTEHIVSDICQQVI